jgi:hypothetical protein
MDSAFRHMAKYMEGMTDENHLIAAMWNLAWAVQFDTTKPDMQNIPNRIKPEYKDVYDKYKAEYNDAE